LEYKYKKYEKLLSKNFPMLKINEFRTSIIKNKSEIKCENLIREIYYENMNIKPKTFVLGTKISNNMSNVIQNW